ncbi:carbohydrate ABC transporter permease [Streptomyces sp. FT05W]|uniref:Carbohydrate ABC transporter permease n=1 Tax=[Kitasatospora] papulosa TaxID=1464011 RepID=A0ABZ1K6K5_9ACTN|nr:MULTISPECIES: carbohydrate ABC transporter permease [Streptomyces]MBD2833781.1 carbohydrate ABC transporter permease [Streptomyces pratensis]RAS31301.1 carbohydrate ABC transporter membrane protein 2 (CUT1 family) [Streptomyces avidinii]TPN26768.1 carbohydrate ABC transporter permease [Mesorhizobium sp. B2-3-3]SNX77345.1 carbohydrate ABC transporter membrane protein 2, CUT1 family [Streptomyces microflavus]MCX4412020.1 carbohydrate ABC transporter permease [[Kitasatospora] papulosa]
MSASTPTNAPAQVLRPDRKRNRLGYNILALVTAALMAFPVYWLIVSSLRPNHEIRSYDQTLWPSSLTFDNFARAVKQDNFATAIQSSLIVSVTAVVGGMIIATLAALAIGRFRFFGRKALMMVMILVQMLPPTAMLIPIYLQLNALGGIDEYWGLIVVYLVSTLPFATIMIRGFVINIPVELEESAMVDGCTRMGAFRRVIFPLLAPGLAAASIFALVNAWNEYLFAYILINDNSKYTLNVWLMTFTTERGTDYGALMAASTLISIPVVIFFMIIQGKMATGLTSGAVKG